MKREAVTLDHMSGGRVVHGERARAAEFAAAGVTWFCESFGPDQPLDYVRRRISLGPPAV